MKGQISVHWAREPRKALKRLESSVLWSAVVRWENRSFSKVLHMF